MGTRRIMPAGPSRFLSQSGGSCLLLPGREAANGIVLLYWELIEPKEGKYDFSTVDALISSARWEGLKPRYSNLRRRRCLTPHSKLKTANCFRRALLKKRRPACYTGTPAVRFRNGESR